MVLFMDYEYYGLSEESYNDLINNRDRYFVDYWRQKRHLSMIKSNYPGDSARIADKNIGELLKKSCYSQKRPRWPQGVFYGYRLRDFIDVHYRNKYILKIDFKSCFRHLRKEVIMDIINEKERKRTLEKPLPLNLVESMYFPYGYLQAGLSASNILADLFFKYHFDKMINKKLHDGKNKLGVYTRYYDDLYISSDDKELLIKIRDSIYKKSQELGTPINYRKSHLRITNGSRILNTVVTIDTGGVRVSREKKNNLRAAIYQLDKIDPTNENYRSCLQSIVVRLEYILGIEKNPNSKYKKLLDAYKKKLEEVNNVASRKIRDTAENIKEASK